MRSVKSELLSVGLVMAIPLGMVAMLPFGSFAFKATAPATSRRMSVSFVRLSADLQRKAAMKAKTSWQQDRDDHHGIVWADISVSELPGAPMSSIMTENDMNRAVGPAGFARKATPFMPSMQAGAPAKISSVKVSAAKDTFTREELLRID